jgi:iron complex outermembrane receptor protein
VSATEAEYDTKNFFVDANYEIDEQIEFFARGLASYNDTFGRFAPVPVYGLRMSQDAPQNPTNPENPTNAEGDPFGGQSVAVDTDGDDVDDTIIDGPFDIQFDYRNVPGGNRDTNLDDTLLDYVAGLRGTVDWLGGADWELAAQWSEQRSDGSLSGLVLVPQIQGAIDDGSFDVFGVFSPYGADEIAVAEAASATGTFDTRHRITGADGQLLVDALQLDNGPVSVALGFEYRDEDYEFNVDEQTAAGNLFGGLGADNVSGARVVKSLFAEAVIPVLSKLEINLAGRHDDYNDFGTTFNPKVSVAFRPIGSLLLRGSWGEGFRAPNMENLYYPAFQGWEWAIDSYRCSLTDEDTDGDGRPDIDFEGGERLPPGHACQWDQVNGVYGGNPDLDPETSRNWNVGFVWNPTPAVTLMADYYDIQIDDEIVFGSAQDALFQELDLRQAGATGDTVGRVTRGPFGQVELIEDIVDKNVPSTETSGLDVEAGYAFSMGRFGDVSSTLRWTHVFEYVLDDDTGGSDDIVGNVGQPEDRGQLIINWALGDFTAATVGNYISDQQHRSPAGYEVSRPSFTTWDVQLGYMTPWNGIVTLGARNVFDRNPPQGTAGGYDISQHEIYGRVPYVRIEQDF